MLELYKAIDAIVDAYKLDLPELYKRRDPDEPHRAEKEMWEDKFYKELMRRFRWQKKAIKKRLENFPPNKKSAESWMSDLDLDDPETRKNLLRIFMGVMDEGVQKFAETSEIDMDWEQVNEEAAEWVNTHYYDHLAGDKKLAGWLETIDDTLRTGLSRELNSFITEPAYTIGDVMSGLGSSLSPERAQRIAVTEITRTFSQADQVAGEAIAREFEDVRVIKTWWTNKDDIVCPICRPLHKVSVLVTDQFQSPAGVLDGPPAHVNCRCWRSTRTDILGTVELQGEDA